MDPSRIEVDPRPLARSPFPQLFNNFPQLLKKPDFSTVVLPRIVGRINENFPEICFSSRMLHRLGYRGPVHAAAEISTGRGSVYLECLFL
jgi:hypothetical protein